jgi:hypothetical protein
MAMRCHLLFLKHRKGDDNVTFFTATTPCKKITKNMKRREGAYFQAPARPLTFGSRLKCVVLVRTFALLLLAASSALVLQTPSSALVLQTPSSALSLQALPSSDDGVRAE